MKAFTTSMIAGLLLAACGGGGDGATADRMPISIPDGGDGQPDAAPVACTATDSYGAATLENQAAISQMQQGSTTPDAIVGGGTLNADTTPDILQLELFKGYSVFQTGEIRPGTYTISGEETNYATCGVCVRIITNVNTQSGEGVDDYLATGGTVEVTSVSPNLTYTLSNITFEHVNIDPQSFNSTPHPDGCASAVTSGSFDAPVMAQ